MKAAAIALLVLGGAVSCAGILLGVLGAPEGESLHVAWFATGLAVGTSIEMAGVAILIADRKRHG